ncbi:arsenosugar biosynthesis radical SAM (seleno)protein ArsS [Algivirga pacifica]|uniref:Arsenosugar biosynthesis radical SAM protein ArsS n=1 Tax=Algivirga pacifica TaxID=1162670 RepID=A0ABP9DIH5_9BACT
MLKTKLPSPKQQLETLANCNVPTFSEKLQEHQLSSLTPNALEILQINLGKMCNQVCNHCHVDAGPDRKEIMPKEIMEKCLDLIKEGDIHTVDLTGGAPEMHPHFQWFVTEVRALGAEVIVRSNLTILTVNKHYRTYPKFFKDHQVIVISSLPCYTADNTDKQRGKGVFHRSIEALKALNQLGYGQEGSPLQLHLVYNPGGPSLPPSQEALKKDYKKVLKEDYDIVFNDLYTITNLPINRFLEELIQKGRVEEYMQKLVDNFNPSAALGVMCTNTLSISWDGYLYDCDFNQMLEMPINASFAPHINDLQLATLQQRAIKVAHHCFGCTAGAGSSCQGALV